MAGEPWWMQRVSDLLDSSAHELGPLWHLTELLQFVRENIDPELLEADFAAHPRSRALWSAFVAQEADVRRRLEQQSDRLATSIRNGALPPASFRTHWEGLGFEPNEEGGGTPADDYLDAMFHMARLTLGEERQAFAMPNMSTRAHRLADFLAVTEPGPEDVVLDIGSGSGKVALTVAASTRTQVRGIEYGGAYVDAARESAAHFGLHNASFIHADVRDVDLSEGSIFYLYYPFHGEPARVVADALGRLGRDKDITVYASGPRNDFGEHFLRQVETGALRLSETRGEFSEVFVLRSA